MNELNTHHALEMIAFHTWANETMIRRLQELPADAYRREVTSSFPTLADALAHIYRVDRGWLLMMQGVRMADAMEATAHLDDEIRALSLEAAEAAFRSQGEEIAAFLRSRDDLDAVLTLDNPYAGIRDVKLSEMALQIVNHGTYHRGNMSAMLRQMGIPSVMTELALYWYVR
ncbi:DinB family protein [Paenibacillus sp. GCM10023250]|uniref:DinB family protein n=1 Tax=Paenibacillus sp. GCM10023250 TaxID=3252648 RepID=UPI00361C02DD